MCAHVQLSCVYLVSTLYVMHIQALSLLSGETLGTRMGVDYQQNGLGIHWGLGQAS